MLDLDDEIVGDPKVIKCQGVGCGRKIDDRESCYKIGGGQVRCGDCLQAMVAPKPLPKDRPYGLNLAKQIERGLVKKVNGVWVDA